MRAEISDHDERMKKRFVASKRHTIEVDFHPYLRQIRRERKRTSGRLRTARRGAPPSGTRAVAAPRARADRGTRVPLEGRPVGFRR